MKLYLFIDETKEKEVTGGCLEFVQLLRSVSSLPPKKCLEIGERLFDCQYRQNNPIEITTIDENAFKKLESYCNKAGISFMLAPPDIPR